MPKQEDPFWDDLRRAKQLKRDTERYMKQLQDEAATAKSDAELQEIADMFQGDLGVTLNDLRNAADESEDQELKARMAELSRAAKAGDRRKVKRLLKNKAVKRGAAAAKKKGGWCSLVALLLLVTASGVLYAAYEGASAVLGLLGR